MQAGPDRHFMVSDLQPHRTIVITTSIHVCRQCGPEKRGWRVSASRDGARRKTGVQHSASWVMASEDDIDFQGSRLELSIDAPEKANFERHWTFGIACMEESFCVV